MERQSTPLYLRLDVMMRPNKDLVSGVVKCAVQFDEFLNLGVDIGFRTPSWCDENILIWRRLCRPAQTSTQQPIASRRSDYLNLGTDSIAQTSAAQYTFFRILARIDKGCSLKQIATDVGIV